MGFYRDLWPCTLCAVLAAFAGLTVGQSERTGCTDTRQAFKATGFSSMNEVPYKAITGDDLRVCPSGYSCCTMNMENELTQISSSAFENVVYEKSSILRDYFIRRAERFDNFIKVLIDTSQSDLHEMFVDTYGQLYEQYVHIFDDLFRRFRNYYHGVDSDLVQVMDDFFTNLFERMFTLLNPHYSYDDSFWECTSQYMTSLKPFGEVPFALRERAKRSFVAARTFVQGLAIGRDSVTKGTKVEPTPECRKALMRMTYCPHCKGIPYVKPCNTFCLNIMKGCLASQAEVDAEWNYFTDAMTMLGTRMEGILNIETFLKTLDIEISTAIMNMQNNGVSISTKVFNGCGIPSSGSRVRREADSGSAPPQPPAVVEGVPTNKVPEVQDEDAEDLGVEQEVAEDIEEEEEEEEEFGTGATTTTPTQEEEVEVDEEEEEEEMMAGELEQENGAQSNVTREELLRGLQGRRGRPGQRGDGGRRSGGQSYRDSRPPNAAGTNLDRLIKDVLKRLLDSRPFWSVLPYMICDDEGIAADVSEEENCWNGRAVGRYENELVGNGISSQVNNPEVNIEMSRPVFGVRTVITTLRTITQQLQSAYNGEDAVFIDTNDVYYSGSGSGSGSGEGAIDPDDNNLFPYSTNFEDPLYRPTRLPADGGASSLHICNPILLSLLSVAAVIFLRC